MLTNKYEYDGSISSHLKRLRKEAGYTQEKMAERLSCDARTIRRWENFCDSVQVLAKYAKVCNVDFSLQFSRV